MNLQINVEKTNLALDVSIETNVMEGMLFHMTSGKYLSFLKILKYFTFPEFHKQLNFLPTDPPAFKFPRLFYGSTATFMQRNIQFTESR